MRIRSNIANQRFGLLVAVKPVGQHRLGKIIWECLCDCGNKTSVRGDNLKSGNVRSCGCLVSRSKYATADQAAKVRQKATNQWRKKNAAHLSSERRASGIKMHNITVEFYEELLSRQNGVCAICKRSAQAAGVSRLDIDHDHRCCPGGYSCGRCIRGLICCSCNGAIGLFQDSREVMLAAVDYLARYSAGAVETERGIGESRKLQSELHGDMQSVAEMTTPATKLIQ